MGEPVAQVDLSKATVEGLLLPGTRIQLLPASRDFGGLRPVTTEWWDITLEFDKMKVLLRPATCPDAPFSSWLLPHMVKCWVADEGLYDGMVPDDSDGAPDDSDYDDDSGGQFSSDSDSRGYG